MEKPFCLASLLLSACFSPNNPIVITASGDDSTGEGSADSTTATGMTATGMTATAADTTAESAEVGDSSTVGSPTTGDDTSTSNAPVCGNGEIEGDEVCDDGNNDGSYGGCTEDCSALGPHCGDGVTNGQEACDDGDEINGNGCNLDCVVSGTVLWTVNSSEGYDFINAGFIDRRVALDPFGDAYIIGTIRDGASSDSVAFARKYSAEGDSIWVHTFNPPTGNAPVGGIGVGAAAEVVFTTSSTAIGSGYARRLTAAGSLEWEIFVAGQSGLSPRGVAVDVDESAVVSGSSAGVGTVLARMSADGDIVWSEVEPNVTGGWRRVSIDDEGDIFTCGGSGGSTARRHTANGTTVWTRTSAATACYSIAATNDGGAVAAGSADGDGWLRRIDADGDVIWTEIYDGPTNDSDLFADVAFDGSHIVLVGYTQAGSERSILIRKYDIDGALLWTQTATGGRNENAGEGVAVDSDDNIFVSGYINAPAGPHLWLRKLTP